MKGSKRLRTCSACRQKNAKVRAKRARDGDSHQDLQGDPKDPNAGSYIADFKRLRLTSVLSNEDEAQEGLCKPSLSTQCTAKPPPAALQDNALAVVAPGSTSESTQNKLDGTLSAWSSGLASNEDEMILSMGSATHKLARSDGTVEVYHVSDFTSETKPTTGGSDYGNDNRLATDSEQFAAEKRFSRDSSSPWQDIYGVFESIPEEMLEMLESISQEMRTPQGPDCGNDDLLAIDSDLIGAAAKRRFSSLLSHPSQSAPSELSFGKLFRAADDESVDWCIGDARHAIASSLSDFSGSRARTIISDRSSIMAAPMGTLIDEELLRSRGYNGKRLAIRLQEPSGTKCTDRDLYEAISSRALQGDGSALARSNRCRCGRCQ